MKCNLCPRRCNAERNEQNNIGGYCKSLLLPRVARAALHFWEEPIISGEKGSGTVFFSGCSLGCVYCQNFEISHKNEGKLITPERLADIFRELEEKGAHNINLVNPTHYVLAIKEALNIYRPNIPIVYNSSGYESEETLNIAKEFTDIYLLDFKYISPDKSQKYSGAYDYPDFAKNTILRCAEHQPENIVENGIMKKGVIVRHLILPQATREASLVFDWVRNNAPNCFFSLMAQYVPFGKACEYTEINRKITKREYEKVLDYIMDSSFENIFIQELSSGDEKYIPDFDLTGI